jgi:hypothetical protein
MNRRPYFLQFSTLYSLRKGLKEGLRLVSEKINRRGRC